MGPDGYVRSDKEEKKINKLLASVFTGNNGAEALKYIRKITIEAVNGPDVSRDKLFHMEGMRYLAAIIEQRIMKGRKDE